MGKKRLLEKFLVLDAGLKNKNKTLRMNPQQVEHANATKARWVTLVHFSSLLLFGNQEPIFKWRDGLEDWQTEQEWLESSSLDRQGAADGAGDEELHRKNSYRRSQGKRREISALQVKTK